MDMAACCCRMGWTDWTVHMLPACWKRRQEITNAFITGMALIHIPLLKFLRRILKQLLCCAQGNKIAVGTIAAINAQKYLGIRAIKYKVITSYFIQHKKRECGLRVIRGLHSRYFLSGFINNGIFSVLPQGILLQVQLP